MDFATAKTMLLGGLDTGLHPRPHRIGQAFLTTAEKVQAATGSCFIDTGSRRKHHGDSWTLMGGSNGSILDIEHGVQRSYGSVTPYGTDVKLSVHVYTLGLTKSKYPQKGRIKLWHIVGRRGCAAWGHQQLVPHAMTNCTVDLASASQTASQQAVPVVGYVEKPLAAIYNHTVSTLRSLSVYIYQSSAATSCVLSRSLHIYMRAPPLQSLMVNGKW